MQLIPFVWALYFKIIKWPEVITPISPILVPHIKSKNYCYSILNYRNEAHVKNV